ncbi:UDP-2,3-diacylglucosamine diphosphatase LpxI [bacterium]|nr:UDP-2,3-diacylglucosamine diphosphatase LpxI [bacterium]
MNKIGIIAGNGKFPFIFAQKAKKTGKEIVIIALKGEADKQIEKIADKVYWINVGKLGKLIEVLKQENVKEAVMAGQVKHTRLFTEIKLDFRTIKLLGRIENKKTDSILGAVAQELEREGIKLLDPCLFLSSLLPKKGVLTLKKPTGEEKEDIKFGFEIAKKIAGLDIGQTVVVKNKCVLAVESLEGTNECILRGSQLGRGKIIVIKVSKPNQDMRFDVPVIGKKTIEVLIQAKVSVLAIEENKTLIFDREEVIFLANKAGISIVVI